MRLVRPAPPGEIPRSRLLETLIDLTGVDDVLHELAILVTDIVPGCDGACFTLDRGRTDPLLVASDLWLLTAEHTRAWSDFGPCLRPPIAGRVTRGSVAPALTPPQPNLRITASLCRGSYSNKPRSAM